MCKIINDIDDGRSFHYIIKTKYPDLLEKQYICNKNKRKLYKLSHLIIKEFFEYLYDIKYKFSKPYDNVTLDKILMVHSLKRQILDRDIVFYTKLREYLNDE